MRTWSDRLLEAAFRRHRWELLLGGLLLGAAAHGPGGIAMLAWFAPVPWLHYLRNNAGPRALAAFVVSQTAMWLLVAATGRWWSTTAAGAVPWVEVTVASAAIGLSHLAWRPLVQGLSPHRAVLVYPLLMLVVEGALRACLPEASMLLLGPRGGAGNEPFLMGLAVGEVGTVFLLRWVPSALEACWETVHPVAMRRHLLTASSAVVVALVAGRVVSAATVPAAPPMPAAGADHVPASPWPAAAALLGLGALLLAEALARRAARRRDARGMIDPW